MFMTAFITAVAAYLLGSISFAVIFSKIFSHKDVREVGSGNAGTTNVFRTGGTLPGILTFFCDALKGFLSSGLGYLMFSYISSHGAQGVFYKPLCGAYICGLFCMIGHVFPLFFGFKGGKGVATSVGIMAVCSPLSIIIGLIGFAATLYFSKYVSLSSLTAALLTVVSAIIISALKDEETILFSIIILIIMCAIVFIKHSDNIKRLTLGEENKIGRR